jgi:hypothetical protein
MRNHLEGAVYTMVLLIYLQSGLSVNLAGATVTGEFKTLALCQKAAVRKRGPLPVPSGYAAAWQDTMCVPINRDVRVGNERETAFEQLLHDAIEPDGSRAEPPCRRADTPQDPRRRP